MAGLHIDACFPGGGVDAVRIAPDDTIWFEAPLDASPRSLWYCFRIRGAAGRNLTLIQTMLDRVLGVRESRGYAPVVPVWRDGGDWRRVPEAGIAFSEQPLQFQFAISPRTDECFVAFCYPYQMESFAEFATTLPPGLVRCESIGVTKRGRDFPRLLIGYPERPGVKRMVVFSARQHAGEVSGSFVLEGVLRALTDGSEAMERLLSDTLICVFPMMDIDCVQEGRYGKDQAPIDFNRDWSCHPLHPEIALVQREVERLAARYRPVWAFDLHAPQPGGASYMPPFHGITQGEALWNDMWRMAIAYEDRCHGKASFHLSDVDTEVLNWGGKDNPGLIGFYYAQRWKCPFNCLEYAYHRDAEYRLVERDDWRLLGRLLAETFAGELGALGGLHALDRSRVPSWTLTPPLEHWETVRKVAGCRLTERGAALHIEPEQAGCHAWVSAQPRDWTREGARCFQIEAESPCRLTVYCSFRRDGLHLTHLRPEYLALDGREAFEYELPPAPEPGCQYVLSAIADDLPGAVTLMPIEE